MTLGSNGLVETTTISFGHWVVVSNIFYFHPYLGEDSQFDEHIFQMGWLKPQPLVSVTGWWFPIFFIFIPIWGKIPNLTSIFFQMGWLKPQPRKRSGMMKPSQLGSSQKSPPVPNSSIRYCIQLSNHRTRSDMFSSNILGYPVS